MRLWLKPKVTWRQVARSSVNIVILIAIFVLGVNIGNGRIDVNIHRNHPVATGLPSTLDYSGVNQVYKSLKDNYDGQLTASQLEDGLKHGLAESTKDPYTE